MQRKLQVTMFCGVLAVAVLCEPVRAIADTVTPWQVHPANTVQFAEKLPYRGWSGQFRHAVIPPVDSPLWQPAPDPVTVKYEVPGIATLGTASLFAKFTAFHCALLLEKPAAVSLKIQGIDSAVRILVLNRFGDTVVEDLRKGFGKMSDGKLATVDLTRATALGLNRVVLLHSDDGCAVARLRYAKIEINNRPPYASPWDQALVVRLKDLKAIHKMEQTVVVKKDDHKRVSPVQEWRPAPADFQVRLAAQACIDQAVLRQQAMILAMQRQASIQAQWQWRQAVLAQAHWQYVARAHHQQQLAQSLAHQQRIYWETRRVNQTAFTSTPVRYPPVVAGSSTPTFAYGAYSIPVTTTRSRTETISVPTTSVSGGYSSGYGGGSSYVIEVEH